MQGKWFVTLMGENFDIQELVKFNSPPEIEIKKEDGMYYLGSEKFSSCKDAREVISTGKKIINVLNGIAKLYFHNWKEVDVNNPILIDADGRRHTFTLCDPAQIRIKGGMVNFTLTKADGTVISSNHSEVTEAAFKIPISDLRVEKALRIYGSREHNWANLYILYEIIETDVGGKNEIITNGWASKSKIDNFKYTANSSKAIGDDARHHNEIRIPPAKPMIISEAKELISNLLKQWLEAK